MDGLPEELILMASQVDKTALPGTTEVDSKFNDGPVPYHGL